MQLEIKKFSRDWVQVQSTYGQFISQHKLTMYYYF